MITRLVRLFRIFKLVNNIPQLRVIVESLFSGMASLFFVVVILVLFFYLFAILAIVMFRENDPVHFGGWREQRYFATKPLHRVNAPHHLPRDEAQP